jgi:hypothetical protein
MSGHKPKYLEQVSSAYRRTRAQVDDLTRIGNRQNRLLLFFLQCATHSSEHRNTACHGASILQSCRPLKRVRAQQPHNWHNSFFRCILTHSHSFPRIAMHLMNWHALIPVLARYRDLADHIKDSSAAGSDALGHACHKAASSVKACTCRIHSAEYFKKLNNVGPSVAGIVQDNLWAKHPPEAASTAEIAAWRAYLAENVCCARHRTAPARHLCHTSAPQSFRHCASPLACAPYCSRCVCVSWQSR